MDELSTSRNQILRGSKPKRAANRGRANPNQARGGEARREAGPGAPGEERRRSGSDKGRGFIPGAEAVAPAGAEAVPDTASASRRGRVAEVKKESGAWRE